MEVATISQVSRDFRVSTRMLRYYEQIGLLSSCRIDGYAYRVYDSHAVSRLQQIIILRKLRISLKQISRIFASPGADIILEVFTQSVSEITDEVTALSTMRSILLSFINGLKAETKVSLESMLFCDDVILAAIDSLSLTKINFKEARSMDVLNKASETLSKLGNVRIVQLPPFYVASYHFVGENPEETVGEEISKFCKEINLYEIKPDARMFGFNNPNPRADVPHYGYEDWVTIPDNLDVPAPFVKKHYKGGLYAVHSIKFPNFNEWEDLRNWVENSEKYEPNYSKEGEENMNGCLEEHLNWIYANHLDWPEDFIDGDMDLFLPIKLK